MKKTTFFFLISTFLILFCSCASNNQESAASIEPSKLDVESFIHGIDINQDISDLSLSDCRILRNGFAARIGYPFRDAYLRGVFMTTTWYDSLQWEFDQDTSLFETSIKYDDNKSYRDNYYESIKSSVLKYTDEQQAFIDRLKAREEELRQHNFDVPEGLRVNIANLINPAQLTDFDPLLQQKLAQQGFAIVPAQHLQLFHVYEQNDYANMPNFVTTDLFLQLYHHYFDCLLRDVEERKLYKLLVEFCTELAAANHDGSDHDWIETYVKIPIQLLADTEDKHNKIVNDECSKIKKSENALSPFLGYNNVEFAYSLFRPRGHYTRNDTLQRYFRAMMWLQTAPFQTTKKEDMRRAFQLADMIGSSPKLNKLYRQLTEPLDFLMGRPDDITILQLYDLLKASGKSISQLDDAMLTSLTKQVDDIAEKQTRIRPKFQRTSRNKVRLMPQRYQPDAEILQEMVDYESKPTQRATPQGLDIFAAMGVNTAEQLLIAEGQQWKDFSSTLKKMKSRMDSINWQSTIANQWLSALKSVNETNDQSPYFMLSPEWSRKQLNSSLASWAELKHDAILYAKQPFGAECGGAGPPEPEVKGYVEPNVAFWRKAIDLLQSTSQLLNNYSLSTEKVQKATQSIMEIAELMLRLSEKELRGELLSEQENDQLEYIGATFENISLDLIREPDQFLMGWDDVQGPDRNTALIADVYTANADNNPDKSILYAAVGQADELYVVVEIGGYLYLMRGAVLSYREFTRPIDQQRLNDEEWQQYLKAHPREGVPQWMKPITVPLQKQPVPNDKFFYSTGC